MGDPSPDNAAQPAVTPPPSASTTRPAATPELWKIKTVKVTFTPAAQEKVAAEPQFTADALLAAIETELRAQKLLDESDPEANDTLGIVIDNFATRSASNAVIFGYALSVGTLEGNLRVLAADGQELRSTRIQARSRLTKPAGTGQLNFFEPLYRGFAALTARNLTGAPEPVGVNH